MKSRINVLLAERRMTKRALARELGVHEMTVSRWSRDDGIESMSLRELARLAEAVGCDPKDLFET